LTPGYLNGEYGSMAWSPDNHTLAFITYSQPATGWGVSTLYLVPTDAPNLSTLSEVAYLRSPVAWRP
jgi:hypothetical protein